MLILVIVTPVLAVKSKTTDWATGTGFKNRVDFWLLFQLIEVAIDPVAGDKMAPNGPMNEEVAPEEESAALHMVDDDSLENLFSPEAARV